MLDSIRHPLKIFALYVWAVVLTALTGVFGAAPLRALRLHLGGWLYWVITVGSVVVLLLFHWIPLAAFFACVGLTVGLAAELEKKRMTLFNIGFWSVLFPLAFIFAAFAIWIEKIGPGWPKIIIQQVETQLSLVPRWNELIKLNAQEITQQIPSLVIILFIFSLFISWLLSDRVSKIFGLKSGLESLRLNHFTVPDIVVWTFLFSFAGAFLKGTPGWLAIIATNFLNVCIVIFFLQGLAVITTFFALMRVGWIWRVFFLTVLVTQLFILVSLIGFADYWMGFRVRLARKKLSMDRKIFKK
ncbi:MAG: YybS family protein [Bdellovibrionales bacterium]|nr:YybS family protein [Bdellovibrionales bacterium]